MRGLRPRCAAALLAVFGWSLGAVGCSLALDTDELRFPDGDAVIALDVTSAEDTPAALPEDSAHTPDDGGPEPPPEDTASPTEDVLAPAPDTRGPAGDTSQPPSIRLAGGASGCSVPYKIKAGVPLVSPDCAQACAPGASGWPVALQAFGPGAADASWTVEATQGIAVAPSAGVGSAFAATLTFGKDNCGSTDAVPPFTVLVTAKFGGATVKESYAFSPTLNSECPAVSCD